jgi:hypothetical protein
MHISTHLSYGINASYAIHISAVSTKKTRKQKARFISPLTEAGDFSRKKSKTPSQGLSALRMTF